MSNICYSYISNRDAEKYLEDCEKRAEIIPMGTGIQGDGYVATMLDKRQTAAFSLVGKADIHMLAEACIASILLRYSFSDEILYSKSAPIPHSLFNRSFILIPRRVRNSTKTVATVADELSAVSKTFAKSLESLTDSSYAYIPDMKVLLASDIHCRAPAKHYADFNRLFDAETATLFGYPVNIITYMCAHRLCVGIKYDPSIYFGDEISRLLDNILRALLFAAAEPKTPLCELSTINQAEKDIINWVNNHARYNYDDLNVVTLFERCAEKHGNKPALFCAGRETGFAQLNQQSSKAASVLKKSGVGKGDYVAIIADRSEAMIISILATLKAGAAYIPIDPSYNKARIDYILSDCSPKMVLVSADDYTVASKYNSINMLALDYAGEELATSGESISGTDTAYCIYTSGTTGTPKGVIISHASLYNFIACLGRTLLPEEPRVPLFTNYAFDLTVPSIFLPLCFSGCIEMISKEDELDIGSILGANRYDFIKLTPSHLSMLCGEDEDKERLTHQCVIVAGGEMLSSDLVESLMKRYGNNLVVYNEYGPTETTVGATIYKAEKNKDRGILPIGKPLDNTRIYICREDRLCGFGVPGELCIAGNGVAKGYHNLPELTSKHFVKCPFGDGVMYRSGDIAMYLADGNIRMLGREDDQVKLHGFRIELSEIEHSIKCIEGVTACVAMLDKKDNGESSLYAYYVSEQPVDEDRLRNELKKVLPWYMVPNIIMWIDKLPLTPNGKLDKKALPKIAVPISRNYLAPRNSKEHLVCGDFAEILSTNVANIGVFDDFFAIGGHSLHATRLVGLLRKQTDAGITISEIFALRTPAAIAHRLNMIDSSSLPPIVASDLSECEMSAAQLRMYLLQLQDGGVAYNLPQCLRIAGEISSALLQRALQALVDKYEIYRTSFLEKNDTFLQRISSKVAVDYQYLQDFSQATDVDVAHALIKPFDLSMPTQLRARLIKRTGYHLLFIDMHHIISDGMSSDLFTRELSRAYNGQALGHAELQYKDYSQWMRKRDLSQMEEYWISELVDAPVLDLPTDFPRQQTQSFRGAIIVQPLDEDLSDRVNKYARKSGATDYMVFLAALTILLGRYGNTDDVVVGSAISGRTINAIEQMPGLFVNTIALRTAPQPQMTCTQFMTNIKDTCIKAYENQEYPFDRIVRVVLPKRDISRNPIYDVMFTLQNNDKVDYMFGDCSIETVTLSQNTSMVDLALIVVRNDNQYSIHLEYCTDLFTKESADLFAAHFISTLNLLVSGSPTRRLGDVGCTTDSEYNYLINQFNATSVEQSKYASVANLFESQAQRIPSSTVLTYGNSTMSYAELNNKANVLADHLLKLGLVPEDRVALLLDRSFLMLIAIMGVLKAGCTYVPIDVTSPVERIEYYLMDSGAQVLITSNGRLHTNVKTIDIGEESVLRGNAPNPSRSNEESKAAYIIYTSGTTGKPKGVVVSNASLINYLTYARRNYLADDIHIPLFTNYSFDLSVTSIFLGMCFGGTLDIIAPEDELNINAIVESGKYSLIKMTPAHMDLCISSRNKLEVTRLKSVIVGGEALKCAPCRQFMDLYGRHIEIHNEYGPTEATVGCCDYVFKYDDIGIFVSTGKPIDNTKIFIVTPGGNAICGLGMPGELCISGRGVARGYHNRPELNAQRFIASPFERDCRMYCSGDLALISPTGNIVFLGRIDDQLKIRGHRVEPSEIENAVMQCGGITSSVVIAREKGGDKTLYCYLTAQQPVDIDALRAQLRKTLPPYMVPTYIAQIDHLPLTKNGKLNKNALPDIHLPVSEVRKEPTTEVEKQIGQFFCEVLGIDRIGVDDSFFEMGGHSLKAIKLINRINAETGKSISFRDFFAAPTVGAIAALLSLSALTNTAMIPKAKTAVYYAMSSVQRRLYFLQKAEGGIAYNMPLCILANKKVDHIAIKAAFTKMIQRHEILRTRMLMHEGQPMQQICAEIEPDFACIQCFEHELDATLKACIEPFVLEDGCPIRARLLETELRSVLFLDMHHAVSDGTSMSVFSREFSQLFNGQSLATPVLQYKDYCEWMQERSFSMERTYWTSLLEDTPVLDIPTDRPRKKMASREGTKFIYSMSMATTSSIKALAKSLAVTEYMVMMAAMFITLSKYSCQDDIVVGTPTLGRLHNAVETMLGAFTNTLVVRAQPKNTKKCSAFIHELREQLLNSYDYQEYPFDELVEQVKARRDPARNPLFDVMFIMQNTDSVRFDLDGACVTRELDDVISKFDMALCVTEADNHYCLELKYNTALYNHSSARGFVEHFHCVAEHLAAKPDTCIGDIEMLTDNERRKIMGAFNRTTIDYPATTMVELFESSVALNPASIALCANNVQMSYASLNANANAVAARLESLQIKPGDYVVLIAPGRPETVVGILGILKAGAAYVPVAPDTPRERLNYIIKDCDAKVVVACGAVQTTVPVIDLLDSAAIAPVEINSAVKCKPHEVAYIIYTSGTSGRPKGVMVEHYGVANLREYFIKYHNVNPSDRILQFASFAFDATISELCMSIFVGASLYFVHEETKKSITLFQQFVEENEITVAILPPPFLAQIKLSTLRTIITAGSETNVSIVRANSANCIYSNDYGPTEATVGSTFWKHMPGDQIPETIPIGKPMPNKQIYIMDNGHLCGIGVKGELCIGGVGLARGYLNMPELTAEKFVDNPFGEGRLFRTGDNAMWQQDGNLVFLGRGDAQINLHGFRIERSEIENVLRSADGVRDAAVTIIQLSDDKLLYAYITADSTLDMNALLEHARIYLPGYMVPSRFIQLDKFPLTRNGKLDYNALPTLIEGSPDTVSMPSTDTEQRIAKLFREVLNIDSIGLDDNFFRMGSHSLKAMRLINELELQTGLKLSFRDFFANPTVAYCASLLACGITHSEVACTSIPPHDAIQTCAMSSVQKRLYTIQQLTGGTLYNMPRLVNISGRIDIKGLKDAFIAMLHRHEILRTSYRVEEGEFVQRINRDIFVDFAEVSMDEIANSVLPFDLTEGNVIRMRIAQDNHLTAVLFDIHHIAADAESCAIFYRELCSIYNGTGPTDPARQYKDFSLWQEAHNISHQQNYWLTQFDEEPPVLDMPYDFSRPQIQSHRGSISLRFFGSDSSTAIWALANNQGVTEHMLFLAAVYILLSKYSHQDDIVIGVPVSGRIYRDTKEMMGMFVNTLPMRSYPRCHKTCAQYIAEIKELSLKAYENLELSLDELIEQINLVRDNSRNPLFDVMFTFQNNDWQALHLDGCTIREIPLESRTAKTDLLFSVVNIDGIYKAELEYCSDLFTESSANGILEHLESLMIGMAENPMQKLANLSVVTQRERMLIANFNNTSRPYPSDKSVLDHFEAQIARTPEKRALVFGERVLTYSQLNEAAQCIAAQLQALGVRKGDNVLILAERKLEVIVGVCAAIKVGAVYVPLDPTCPSDRIRLILDDCHPAAVLTCGRTDMGDIPVIDISNLSALTKKAYSSVEVTPSDIAYIIYTSGTTGRPKGVQVLNRNIVNLVMNNTYTVLDDHSVILQTGQVAFDASTYEIWGAFLNGGELHLIDESDLVDTPKFKSYLRRTNINTIFITTALFNQHISCDPEVFDSLKHLMFGGETSSEEHVAALRDRSTSIDFRNVYGPTETTTFATHYKIDNSQFRTPIGKPIANVQVYIADGDTLCGIGMPGELCIAGDGVAYGYLNHPALTSEKFVDNVFGCGRMYRSGDLARWLPDGNIEYIGRMDDQVKIRGFRIELEEINTTLNSLDYINMAVTILRTDDSGEKDICSYVVSDNQINIPQLRADIAAKLPTYMVPAHILQIDHIKLNQNGKVDRQALPKIEVPPNKKVVPASNKSERALIKAFSFVLKNDYISVFDNFFELGGDSIRAIRAISKLRIDGYETTLHDIMAYKTISEIAKHMTVVSNMDSEQGEVSGKLSMTPIIRWFFSQNCPNPSYFNQSVLVKAPVIDIKALSSALTTIATHHDMLRAVIRDQELCIRSISEGNLFSLAEYFLSASGKTLKNDLLSIAHKEHSSMSIGDKPWFKAVVMRGASEDYLLLILHHLTSDGISLRIIKEDLETAYNSALMGKQIVLPPKTTSFRAWADAILSYEQSHTLNAQYDYWQAVTKKIPKAILPISGKPSGQRSAVQICLDKEQTHKLLTESCKAYGTEINDLLLAALSMACRKGIGKKTIAVKLETHGRSVSSIRVPVERTVGWFTSFYPLLLTAGGETGDCIVKTRNTLKTVPDNGSGYGVLVYGANPVIKPIEPNIVFNYLGEMDESNTSAKSIFSPSTIDCGDTIDPDNFPAKELLINGMVQAGSLYFTFAYDTGCFEDGLVRKIATAFVDSLAKIVHHCCEVVKGKANRKVSADDFNLGIKSQRELNELLSSINEMLD